MNWNDSRVKSDIFSLRLYSQCLEKSIDLGYDHVRIKETINPLSERCLILRHDIEYSIDCAYRMAKLESEYGIKSSYYVLLHSKFYNPFTQDNTKKLLEIASMGHEIGLHYETYYFEDLSRSTVDGIIEDVKYLENMLNIKISSISQHRPARSSVVAELNEKFIDSYQRKLIFEMYYISDSGCKWRNLNLYESIGTEAQIHALIHPDYWGFNEDMSLPDIYRTIARENSQEIINESELLISQNYDYLLRREQMDLERRNKYAK